MCAILLLTSDSVITDDLDLFPSVVTYPGKGKGFVLDTNSNCSTPTVSIQPQNALCVKFNLLKSKTNRQKH